MSDSEIDRHFAEVDRRFTVTDGRFTGLERRIDGLDQRLEDFRREVLGHFDRIYARLERLETSTAGARSWSGVSMS